jgi:hypothetical protein
MQRPDGSQSTVIGWILIGAGIFAALFAAISPNLNWLIIWIGLANLGIGLGVVLLSLGYLVRAIWFLPGREFDADGAELQKCDYCDFKIAAPSQPCSAMRSDQVGGAADRIDSDNCRRVLALKGIL